MEYAYKEIQRMRYTCSEGDVEQYWDHMYGKGFRDLDRTCNFDEQNVFLTLSADAKRIFQNSTEKLTPVVLCNLNLSPDLRCRLTSIIPYAVIPGPK